MNPPLQERIEVGATSTLCRPYSDNYRDATMQGLFQIRSTIDDRHSKVSLPSDKCAYNGARPSVPVREIMLRMHIMF